MKIRSFLLLVLLSIFTYLPGLAQKTLQNIVKKGELKIGMTGNQPPYTMKSKTGELIGFEHDSKKWRGYRI